MTPEPSHDTEIIEMEPQQQNNDEVEQDVDTQEQASLNVLVQVAAQMREEEPGIEDILEFNEEICIMTPELSHDVDILEMESQQGDEEVNQDVATQEPTSLKIGVETLGMQQEANPELDIIPDVDLGEDEQAQSQSSGDNEIHEEQLHIEEDI